MNRLYRFGPYELIESEMTLLRNGEPVIIRPKVLMTLLVLVSRSGRLVPRSELLETVWPENFVEDGNLSQNISVLRKMLRPDFPDADPIDTVAKLGYRFRPAVQSVDGDDFSVMSNEHLVNHDVLPSDAAVSSRPVAIFFAAGIALLLLAGFATTLLHRKHVKAAEAARRGAPYSIGFTDLASANSNAYRLYLQGLDRLEAFDYVNARDLLQQSVAADPEFPLAHLELSIDYRWLQQNQAAIDEALVAQRLDGNLLPVQRTSVDLNLAIARNQCQQAAAALQKFLAPPDVPGNFQVVYDYFYCLQNTGQYRNLLTEQRQITERFPFLANDPLVLYMAANAHKLLGDYDVAFAMYQHVKDESLRRKAMILYERSETEAALLRAFVAFGKAADPRQKETTLAEYQDALSLAKQYGDVAGEVRAMSKIGESYCRNGDIQQGFAILEQALAIEKTNGLLRQEAGTLQILADNQIRSDDFVHGLASCKSQLDASQQINDAHGILSAQLCVAVAQGYLGEIATAKQGLEQVLEEASHEGDMSSAKAAQGFLASYARISVK